MKFLDNRRWIWVEGYKGLNENMQGYDGFQYELNKEYYTEKPVILCQNGFHFCLNLEEVFIYYSFRECNKNRFFKVKALVKKKDFDEYEATGFTFHRDAKNKLVASRIILTEEIPQDAWIIQKFRKRDDYIRNLYKKECLGG